MDDPTWLDYVGLAFNVLATAAGLFGLFLAIKAYKIGVRAYKVSAESYRVAKDQGRKTFELEVLRELRGELDKVFEAEERDSHIIDLPRTSAGIYSALLALPEGDLPLWRMVSKNGHVVEKVRAIRKHPIVASYLGDNGFEIKDDLYFAVINSMYDEVGEAMRRRFD